MKANIVEINYLRILSYIIGALGLYFIYEFILSRKLNINELILLLPYIIILISINFVKFYKIVGAVSFLSESITVQSKNINFTTSINDVISLELKSYKGERNIYTFKLLDGTANFITIKTNKRRFRYRIQILSESDFNILHRISSELTNCRKND